MPENRSTWINQPGLGIFLALGVWGLLLSGAGVSPAWAHRMLVFALPQGEVIQVESKFVPDTPVRQGKVLVLDKKTGRELMSGLTDDQGKFAFRVPPEAEAGNRDLQIVVEAGMGHRGEWVLKAGSYGKATSSAITPDQVTASPPITPAPPSGTRKGDPQDLEVVLEKALERQLAPIRATLAEMAAHRVTFTDIVAGLGYIVGLLGFWAYMKSRSGRIS